jgi:HEAT repeat protein
VNAYENLVVLALRELELVQEGRWDELASVDNQRRTIVEGLPDIPPPEAHPHLLEAERIVSRSIQASALALADTRARLAQLRSRRRKLAAGTAPALNSHA